MREPASTSRSTAASSSSLRPVSRSRASEASRHAAAMAAAARPRRKADSSRSQIGSSSSVFLLRPRWSATVARPRPRRAPISLWPSPATSARMDSTSCRNVSFRAI